MECCVGRKRGARNTTTSKRTSTTLPASRSRSILRRQVRSIRHWSISPLKGFRPDLIVIDTWFKSTAGAKVSDQAEMTAALEQLTIFQKTLGAVTEFKDALPQVTVLIIAHTDKKGVDLFGSVTQFANCDVLYMLKREAHSPRGHPFMYGSPRHRGAA